MEHAREPDEWLMGQVALGKREYLGPLVRRYGSPLLTFLERMVSDRHRAEELFQDVFFLIWSKRSTYKFPRPFRAWLFAIAANHCRAEFRRARAPTVELKTESPFAPASSDPGPVETLVATETAQLVSAGVTQLPPKQRTVLVLRVWNGMSYAQIAEIVGRSEATVRTHMHHGLASLRKYLEPRM